LSLNTKAREHINEIARRLREFHCEATTVQIVKRERGGLELVCPTQERASLTENCLDLLGREGIAHTESIVPDPSSSCPGVVIYLGTGVVVGGCAS